MIGYVVILVLWLALGMLNVYVHYVCFRKDIALRDFILLLLGGVVAFFIVVFRALWHSVKILKVIDLNLVVVRHHQRKNGDKPDENR